MDGRKPVGKSGKGSCGEKGGMKNKGGRSYQCLRKQRAEVRYAQKVKPGLDVRLIRIHPLMLIWLHLSIAKTPTTLRSLRVLNVKENNGPAKTMERAELGKDWN